MTDLEQMARELVEVAHSYLPAYPLTTHLPETCPACRLFLPLTALLQRVRDERDEEWEKVVLEVEERKRRDAKQCSGTVRADGMAIRRLGEAETCCEILRRMGRKP